MENFSALFKASLLSFGIVFLSAQGHAQNKKKLLGAPAEIDIPMEPSYWEYDSAAAEFTTYKNVKVVKGKNGKGFQVFLKGQGFTNGTIEFDVELSGTGFPGINFRLSADKKTGDNFYIRSFGPVNPDTRTTLQYAAVIDGVSMWDLSDEYQSGATIYQDKWNHVKLVISGKQMKAYVNDMQRPALLVPELESLRDSGSISLSGNVIYSNFVIRPNRTEGLSAEAGYTSASNDTRYLRTWRVSTPIDFPFGHDIVMSLPSMYGTLDSSEIPKNPDQWKVIKAESRSVVNLSRIYGLKGKDSRQLAWLHTTLQSSKAQDRILSLGFSDEVWLFINGQILYVGKNYFGTPEQMSKGRCIIENATIKLPLKEGKNDILIGLANYFYGWGIIARLDDTDGIQIEK